MEDSTGVPLLLTDLEKDARLGTTMPPEDGMLLVIKKSSGSPRINSRP